MWGREPLRTARHDDTRLRARGLRRHRPTPSTVSASSEAREHRRGARSGRSPRRRSPLHEQVELVGAQPLAEPPAPVERRATSTRNVGLARLRAPPAIGTVHSPPPAPVSTIRAVRPGPGEAARLQRGRHHRHRALGHRPQRGGRRHVERPDRARAGCRRCASRSRTRGSTQHEVGRHLGSEPAARRVAGHRGAHRGHRPPPQRGHLGERPVARDLDRPPPSAPRPPSSSTSGSVGTPNHMREQALHRGEVHDELAHGQAVERREIERRLRATSSSSSTSVASTSACTSSGVCARGARRARARSNTPVRTSRGGASASLAASPAAAVRSRSTSPTDLGVRGDVPLDRVRLVGVARVEREGSEQLLELFAADHVHCSTPFPSRAAAMRRSPRRRRDFAVPSGIPNSTATCR